MDGSKEKCRLNEEDIKIAKEMGLNPKIVLLRKLILKHEFDKY